MNAVLQGLSSSDYYLPFLECVLDEARLGGIDCANEMPLCVALRNVLKQLRVNEWNQPPLKPLRLCLLLNSALSDHFHHFGQEQEDAGEFYMFLTSVVEKERRAAAARMRAGLKSLVHLFPDVLTQSPIDGRFMSMTLCGSCNHLAAYRCSLFVVATLPAISSEGEALTSVKECLDRFARTEEIEGAVCEHCHQRVRLRKCMRVLKPPNVLCINLKRKVFDPKLQRPVKLLHAITTPLFLEMHDHLLAFDCKRKHSASHAHLKNILRNMLGFDYYHFHFGRSASSEEGKAMFTYRLAGKIVHVGGASGQGHYTAYRRLDDDSWIFANDASVRRASRAEVIKAEGSLLLYEITNK